MKSTESKQKNIRYIFLIFISIVLILQLLTLFPNNEILASSEVSSSNYIIESFIKNYHFNSDGTVEVSSQIDLQSSEAISSIALSIPHAEDQSLIIDSLLVGDINEDLTASNYVQKIYSPVATDAGETYFYETGGGRFDLTINAPFPVNTRKRVQLKYTILSSSIRYSDSAVSSLAIVSANTGADIEKLGVSFSFESEIYDEERERFDFYERNNLTQVENTLHLITPSDLHAYLGVPNETGIIIDEDSFTIAAEDIAIETSVNLRIVFPSDWIPLASIQSSDGSRFSTSEIIREEEEAYRRTLYQRYEYRDNINIIIIVLFIIFVLITAIYFIVDFARRRFDAREQISSPPADAHPAILLFLDKLEVTSRVLWSIIYSLSAKKFIHLDDNKITRIYERLLPDNNQLEAYESVVLHWLWSNMEGENEIQLNDLNKKIAENNLSNNQYVLRISRLLELECIERSWLKINRQEGFNYIPLVIGLVYLIAAIVMSVIGAYYNPLTLIFPALILIGISLVSSQYTNEGLNIRRQTNAYSSYLANIDRYVKREENTVVLESEDERDLIITQLIYSIALDVDKDYLQALKYIYSIDEIFESRTIEFLGLRKTNRNILNRISEEKISLREQSAIYNQTHEQIENRIFKMQAALNRVNITSVNVVRR